MQPKDQTTPMMTINREKTTGVALRKNKSRINAVTNTAKPRNMVISEAIFLASTVRI